jgi:hypothetical protein
MWNAHLALRRPYPKIRQLAGHGLALELNVLPTVFLLLLQCTPPAGDRRKGVHYFGASSRCYHRLDRAPRKVCAAPR